MNESKSFVITSSVGGEGKSTTSANLAVALAATGSRVALVEGDLRRPKVADYLGLERAVGLTTVLIGQATITDVMQSWGNGQLHVLPAGRVPPNPSELLGSQAMQNGDSRTRSELRLRADRCAAAAAGDRCDSAQPDRAEARSSSSVQARFGASSCVVSLETLAAVDAPVHGLILNFLPTKGPDAYIVLRLRLRREQAEGRCQVRQLASRRQLLGRAHDHACQRPPYSQGRRQALTSAIPS